ncbi:ATP-dependent DNA ligase [Klebsiella phage vB_Kpn_K80PH1317a]|uniref:DNA ligase n=1 Tax=Klebsiella phage vB_Kpn_K80PH1317a TaxID=3071608 RepID=A0AAD2Q047_9CAUD|nr:ATP-dependent DNA ligase [Klebsiella phage vB_Kpn_K80PH1317b]CAK1257440.1 ATP-dependent DNA ligase [Klebsiella phage vB_Kpn_K80PH1317a]
MMNIKTNPFKAVSFVRSAIEKALETSGYLIADTKHDGIRGNICVDNTANAAWLSRVSKTIPALEHLNGFDARWQKLLRDDRWIFPDGFMLDGELMVKGVDFNTGSGLLRTKWLKKYNMEYHNVPVTPDMLKPRKVGVAKRVRTEFRLSTAHLKVVLYDIIPLDIIESGDDYNVMTLLRLEHVKVALPVLQDHFPEVEWCLSESHEVYDMDELDALYRQKREEGHEGLVVKDPQGIYKRGKKSGWFKCKPNDEADGIIQGVNWGTPGLANEGKVIGFSVLLETGRLVDANNISRALMDEFTTNVKEHGEEYYNGWSCQIGYMEETKDGSLRHPSFTCFRGTEDNPSEKI